MMEKKYINLKTIQTARCRVWAPLDQTCNNKKLYPRRLTRPTEETKPIILEGELFKAIKDLFMIVNFPFIVFEINL